MPTKKKVSKLKIAINIAKDKAKSSLKFLKKASIYGLAGAALAFIGYNGTQFLNSLKERDIKDTMLSSHVTVVGERGLGSGVVVRSDAEGSLVLTNKHVCLINKDKRDEFALGMQDEDIIEYKPFVVVKVHTGEQYVGQAMKIDTTSDLCLLHVAAFQVKSAKLASQDLQYGDVIFNVSNPLGLGGFITQGYVGKQAYILGALFTHSTVTIYPGSSGSGVFNEAGELVGLIARGGSPGFSFHVPLSHIKLFLEGADL